MRTYTEVMLEHSKKVRYKSFSELPINKKIFIKAFAMSIHGKRVHWSSPDTLNNRIDELSLIRFLSEKIIHKNEKVYSCKGCKSR